jgi:hypothetical protein
MLKRKQRIDRPVVTAVIMAVALVLMVIGVFFDIHHRLTSISERPAASRSDSPADVRPAAVAGSFYPASPQELGAAVDGYLAAVGIQKIEGRPKMLLAPHAGYAFSGPVAAYSFRSLAGSGYKRAVLIGTSHSQLFDGVVADSHDVWETPLGTVVVDRLFIDDLVGSSGVVRYDSSPHEQEHSLEVMVPFLIKTLGPDMKIVPLLFGNDDGAAADKLAQALGAMDDPQTVFIISSDLVHYPPYDQARGLDEETIASVLTNDPQQFASRIRKGQVSETGPVLTLACARTAIESGLFLSGALGLKPQLLNYANSGDAAGGDRGQVVGYAAVAFVGPMPIPMATAERELDMVEQRQAIEIVRQTLTSALENENYVPPPGAAIFGEKRGVFVTLKKDGQLRGCIGVFDPDEPLSSAIRSMAWAAAFKDSRFQPLQKNELPELEIEVSVLSPMVEVSGSGAIELGRHGVYLRQGPKSGVFLPQVATEQNWDKETFLSELCLGKAGLDRGCWQDSRTEMFVFTAQVFGGSYSI